MFICSQTYILQIHILSCVLESSIGISHGHLNHQTNEQTSIIFPPILPVLWNALPQQTALLTIQVPKPETDSQKTQILFSKHSCATY